MRIKFASGITITPGRLPGGLKVFTAHRPITNDGGTPTLKGIPFVGASNRPTSMT